MAKSKRGSDENLFSISGAAKALGRARRTITRALKGIKPDVVRSGLSLWRMQTIINAVNTRTQAPILSPGDDEAEQRFRELFEQYDADFAAVKQLPTVAARRAAMKALAPLVRDMLEAYSERDTQSGLHEDHVLLRGDRMLHLLALNAEYEAQLDWTHREIWRVLNSAFFDEEEVA